MEQKYWTERGRSATAMARAATSSKARLAHYELAGLHSIKAAQSGAPAGVEAAAQAAEARLALHIPDPAPNRPGGGDPGPGERS
ncbi:MAG: hypothetical protein M3N07_05560 [Pseudomonadota bacterium]|nr:hypothetical protein [Pseudomonadota bacterium]